MGLIATLQRAWGWLTRQSASSGSLSPPPPTIERVEARLISFESNVSASLTGLEAKIASVEKELAIFHPSLNPWLQTDAASVETSPSERDKFKQELRTNYQPDEEPGQLTCMASGARLPSAKIRAAHIWPARARSALVNSWFGLSQGDLETCRNGLLLAESIEKNFDELRIAFSYHPEDDSFKVRILDNRLRGPTQFIGELDPKTTYSSIDGKPLLLRSNCKKPFRRLLAFHYANAMERVRVKGWNVVPETPHVPADEKVLNWLNEHSPGAKWPGVQRYTLKTNNNTSSRGTGRTGSSSSSAVQ